MSIFDLNQKLLASYPHKKSKFCNELEKTTMLFNIVLIVIIKLWNMSKTGELYIYKCHFGLNEAIMPLYSYGSLTGYLMMGQAVIGTYRNYSEIIEKSKEYFQDKEILKKYITEITILNEEQVYAFANICDVCAKYISLTNRIQAKHDHLAQEVKHYIIANYNKQITIEELCSYFSVVVELLNHFKSKYNTTIHQCLLDYRLKKATELLINDELNVKEIAYFCGF